MNKIKFTEIVTRYKNSFNEHRPQEIYKWEAVKCFQDNWDDQADDFKSMLKKSLNKQKNLLSRYEIMGLNRLVNDYPNELRNILLQLFNDDGASIVERTMRFLSAVASLSTSDENNVIKHNQTERAASVYLFLMKPEENYIYNRVGKFERFAISIDYTDYPSSTGLEKLKSYYDMCDKIREYVIEDQELLSMSANSIATPDGIYYQDINYRLLTDDIVYIGSKFIEDVEWWPSLEAYNPGIGVDKWKQLWENTKIFNDDSKLVLSCFLSFEGGATCKQASIKFGRKGEFYNRISSALAERVHRETSCELPPDDKNAIWWPILYVGKRAGKDIEGSYIWKLRQELRDALEELGIEPPVEVEKQNLENEFVLWFQTQTNNGKPYKENYIYAIRKTLRAICKSLPDIELEEPNLFYQTDFEAFKELQTIIRNSEFYDSINKKTGSGVFSAGMDHYERFLEVRSGGKSIDGEISEDDDVNYYSEIIRALKEFGGKALWRDICDNIEERGVLPAIFSSITWKQTVSSYLQFKCSDSPQYKGKEDLFSWDKATKIWGLRDYDTDVLDEPETFPIRSPRQSPKHQMNVILYGAPGTGKTYSVTEYAVAIYEDRDVRSEVLSEDEREALLSTYKGLVSTGHVVFTTFHQSYGYEDFIQGLRPVPNSETLKFNVEDGVFKNISDRAMNDDDNNYVIIIDEINRANISKVFGELITLIESDKRWGEANELSITLPSGSPFAIPNNLYIIGTMNSADKSISLIDTALRRRFDFIEIAPNATLIENRTLRKVLKALNKELLSELDSSDFLIGHAYFINKTEADLVNIMNRNIIPLLYEYFHDNEKKVKAVVSKAIEEFEYGIDENENRIGRLKIV